MRASRPMLAALAVPVFLILSILPATAAPPEKAAAAVAKEKVNINTASVKELMSLAGVGRKVAEKIVEYRDTHGPFRKPDELRKVDGVGTSLWEQNRGRIVVK